MEAPRRSPSVERRSSGSCRPRCRRMHLHSSDTLLSPGHAQLASRIRRPNTYRALHKVGEVLNVIAQAKKDNRKPPVRKDSDINTSDRINVSSDGMNAQQNTPTTDADTLTILVDSPGFRWRTPFSALLLHQAVAEDTTASLTRIREGFPFHASILTRYHILCLPYAGKVLGEEESM
ncbi:hypothetical protein HYPSUDRAFT_67158 [Hypholoma sublateritium FD-334 SS-4]|uniref:Uncharacterized protein n=1 Tax=Hypholoma sublateritium (strain FD-334 SS-4) TaxID=945553 RepID=A0A0D2NTT6_HYPSF|nr:hypothetical protein HYPSUDRAFT_67158 [Hypholoma sublateritium FD-334 SS-4]